MKAKVLRRFLDKQNGVIHPVGKIIEVTEARFEEITSLEGDPLIERTDEKPVPSEQTDLPVDLKGSVNEVNALIHAELEKEILELLLKAEKEGSDRKGVIKHIESLLKADD